MITTSATYDHFVHVKFHLWMSASEGLEYTKEDVSNLFRTIDQTIDQKIVDEADAHFNGIKKLNPVRIFNTFFEISFTKAADRFYHNFYQVRKIFIKKAKDSEFPREIIVLILSIFPLPNLNCKIFITEKFKEICPLNRSTRSLVVEEMKLKEHFSNCITKITEQ